METSQRPRWGLRIFFFVLLAALIALAVYYTSRDQRIPLAAQALSAEHTVAMVGAQRLDVLFNRVQPVLGAGEGRHALLDALLGTGTARRETMGFDPAQSGDWGAIGLDSEVGVSIALDERLSFQNGLRPLLLCRVLELQKFLAYVEKTTGIKGVSKTDNGFDSIQFADATLWRGNRGGIDVFFAGSGPTAAVLKPLFLKFLNDGGATLDTKDTYRRTLPTEPDPTLAFVWVNSAAASRVSGSLPVLAPLQQSIEFYAGLFPAASMILGDTRSSARLLATDQGKIILEQLLQPRKPGPAFTQYLPPSGWAAFRTTVNFQDALSGLTQVLPPAVPDGVRKSLGLARMLIPLTLGVSWESLVRAYSGHMVVASAIPSSIADLIGTVGWSKWFVMVGLGDATIADRVTGKLFTVLKKKLGVEITMTEVDGKPAWSLRTPIMNVFAQRHENVLFFGPGEQTVLAARARAKGQHLSDPRAVETIDGNNVFGAWLDLSPLLAAPQKADSLVPKTAKSDMTVSARLLLDDRGVRGHLNSKISLTQILELAPSFGLPGMPAKQNPALPAPKPVPTPVPASPPSAAPGTP